MSESEKLTDAEKLKNANKTITSLIIVFFVFAIVSLFTLWVRTTDNDLLRLKLAKSELTIAIMQLEKIKGK